SAMSEAHASRHGVPTDGYQHLIDGTQVASASRFAVINPATGQPFAECPSASEEELERAVLAARRSLPEWQAVGPDRRRMALHALAASIEADIETLAAILTSEQGKPLVSARDEIQRAAVQMRRLSEIPLASEPGVDSAGRPFEVQYRPLGVVGAITPWNMPVLLAASKISHALYTGNTVVLKPSPYTPLATLRLGALARGILPPGVLNILAGTDDLGRWMTAHPGIAKLSFTGSVRSGKSVMATAAATLKRVTLELGGNDAAVVLQDADPASIAQRLLAGAFTNGGQICMAIKRLYIEAPIYDAVCTELAERVARIVVGDGFDPAVAMGPVQNAMQYDTVRSVLAEASHSASARILGGSQSLPATGYFVAPRVIAGPDERSRLVQEETFGPLLPVMRFDDVDEVIARANNSRYGLSGSVWSADRERAAALASRLEVGTAWVNHHLGSDPLVPFGGSKESGIGREMALTGLRHYMEPRVLSVRQL
ncbi:MAG: aldehyde dehydrogenase family protein, partial [Pigmentiphaga sp.]